MSETVKALMTIILEKKIDLLKLFLPQLYFLGKIKHYCIYTSIHFLTLTNE